MVENLSYSYNGQPAGEPPKNESELRKDLEDVVEAARKLIVQAGLPANDIEIVRRVISKFRATPGSNKLQRIALAASAVKAELQKEREQSNLADKPFSRKPPVETANADDQLARVMGGKVAKKGIKDQ